MLSLLALALLFVSLKIKAMNSRPPRSVCASAFILLVALSELCDAGGPPTTPLWEFEVPGYRPAQFGMVDNGELYVSSYNGHVYQLDLKTGALINDWLVTKDYNGCYSAPLKVDGKLYVYDMRKKFYRLDKKPTATATILYDAEPGSNSQRTEALAYDSVSKHFLLNTGQSVVAIDKTGARKYTLSHGNVDWAEPMANDGYLYTGDDFTGKIYKYDAKDGSPIWSQSFGASNTYLSKGNDGSEDMIFAVGWEGTGGSKSKLATLRDSNGSKKWELSFDHRLKSASLWENNDDPMLILPTMNGNIEWRRALTGELIRSHTLSAGVTSENSPWQQVVISGDYGIVSTHDTSTVSAPNHTFVIDLKTGNELWRSDPYAGSGACMIPILSEGVIITGTYFGGKKWYAFDLGDGNAVNFSRMGNQYNTGVVDGGLTSLTGDTAPPPRR